jgi:hypothetical protein
MLYCYPINKYNQTVLFKWCIYKIIKDELISIVCSLVAGSVHLFPKNEHICNH